MTDPAFFSFLGRALDALAAEVPTAYAVLCRRLGVRTIRLTVDGEVRCLRIRGSRHSLEPDGVSDVGLRTDRAALVDIVEAHLTLLDAILLERLALRGSPEHLATLYDALVAFVQGAVRSRSLPALLDEYLSGGRFADSRRDDASERRRTTAERG